MIGLDLLATQHDRFESGEPNYSEMLWCMRLCFLTRARVDAGRTTVEEEGLAWDVAKLKMGPLHLASYCHVVLNQLKITEAVAADWFRQIEEEFGDELEFNALSLIRKDRERHEGLAAENQERSREIRDV